MWDRNHAEVQISTKMSENALLWGEVMNLRTCKETSSWIRTNLRHIEYDLCPNIIMSICRTVFISISTFSVYTQHSKTQT